MLRRDDPAFKRVVDAEMIRIYQSGEISKTYDKWFMKPIPPKGAQPGDERGFQESRCQSDRQWRPVGILITRRRTPIPVQGNGSPYLTESPNLPIRIRGARLLRITLVELHTNGRCLPLAQNGHPVCSD